ncbi:cysteine protease StiP family protein [Brevibacillus sp. RS1.1]|uniref:cysteine protease StiP family protein n=1 Tax=Brevibacillus sp. RS1.1 TaxID=2738982 RepID=UPI00156AB76D|nr:cysteine protease StiP family protein [Brevibacillus sp. RS1.1]NRR03918.1 cysteine protease StiP family protein [Brevibacillus sp. RS1.1]
MEQGSLYTAELMQPIKMGSYPAEDVTFLLKEISGLMEETNTEDREELIQAGTHYSEMLPVEYQPSAEYISLFHQALQTTARKVALASGVVAESILARKGKGVVLASLARAGTPIGVLIRRYLRQIHQLDTPHYSISIIRGKGIDENALRYILEHHPGKGIQFVDGWTGKGAITSVLHESISRFNQKFHTRLDADLAVLADPGHCVQTFGTREDFLIPSACLNSTVSGLISRTVHRDDLIAAGEFHGAKFYREWADEDVSNLFVNTISAYFTDIADEAKAKAAELISHEDDHVPTWKGMRDIGRIQQELQIDDVNLIKPGVGETTRVLLRRVPWKILVDSVENPNLAHIIMLAKDRGVFVEERSDMSYSCCGIIRSMGGEKQ